MVADVEVGWGGTEVGYKDVNAIVGSRKRGIGVWTRRSFCWRKRGINNLLNKKEVKQGVCICSYRPHSSAYKCTYS